MSKLIKWILIDVTLLIFLTVVAVTIMVNNIPVSALPSTDPSGQGQCLGYPDGICESNPNQGENDKDCVNTNSCTDPSGPTYDQWGNEFSATGTLINTGSCDPNSLSGPNPYCPAPTPPDLSVPVVGK